MQDLGGATVSAIATARIRRRTFVGRRAILLAECAAGRRTRESVVVTLETFYSKQTRDFVHRGGGDLATWGTYGPLVEIEEVRAAFRDGSWGRLVEKYATRAAP